MKRIWGLIIALLLLSGCGAQKPVVSETNEPPAQNVPATETTTETTTEATEEAEQFDAAKEKAYEDAVYFFSQFELGRIYAVDPASGETVYDDAAVAALYQTFLRLDGYKDSETYLERFYAVEDVLLRKAVTYIDREGNVSQFPPIRYAYHADGSLWKVMDYQKENGYSDHNLALLDVSGSANEIVFSYEKGSLSEIWVGTDDRTYLQSAVVWNEQGKKAEEHVQTQNGDTVITYTYQEETGYLTEKRVEFGNQHLSYLHTYTYNEEGVLISSTLDSITYDSINYTYRFRYTYDEAGLLVQTDCEEIEWLYNKVCQVSSVFYTYENGRLAKEQWMAQPDSDGYYRDSYPTKEWVYLYGDAVYFLSDSPVREPQPDETVPQSTEGEFLLYREWITEDTLGNVNRFEYPYVPLYRYDSQGRIVEITNAGLAEEINDLGITGIGGDAVFSYDEANRLVHVNMADGRATVIVLYDDQGRRQYDLVTIEDESYEVSYLYTEETGLLREKRYSPDGYTFYEEEYNYNEKGVLLSVVVRVTWLSEVMRLQVTDYTYDTQGRLVMEEEEIIGVYTEFSSGSVTEYTYENDQLVEKTVSNFPVESADGTVSYEKPVREHYTYVYGSVEDSLK